MTSNLRRLQTIEALFASRETAAISELANYEKVLNEAQQQLKTLRDYRNGYLNGENSGPSLSANHFQNHASFMRRLNEAIAQQEETTQRAKMDCDSVRQRYQLCRQRTMAVGKAHGKRLASHRASVERREQKEADQWRGKPADPDS